MTLPATPITGQMIDAAWMNANVRDVLNSINAHGHAGGVLDGEQKFTSMDSISWDHQSGLGAGASGHAKVWMASDGTVRVHNNSGSELTLSDTGHTH